MVGDLGNMVEVWEPLDICFGRPKKYSMEGSPESDRKVPEVQANRRYGKLFQLQEKVARSTSETGTPCNGLPPLLLRDPGLARTRIRGSWWLVLLLTQCTHFLDAYCFRPFFCRFGFFLRPHLILCDGKNNSVS